MEDQGEYQSNYYNLLDKKIGYGEAQERLGMPTTLLVFSEGFQIISFALILPILTKEWDLTTDHQTFLLTFVGIGIPLGTLLQGFADHFGRSLFITFDAALLTIFGLLSTICWNLASFTIVRCLYCVGIGISMNLTATYLNQISPTYMKSTLMTRPFILFSLGSILSCVLGWLFLPSKQWRFILLIICIPGLVALVIHLLTGRESLHFLWVQKKKEETIQMIAYMCELNERLLPPREQILELMMTDHDQDEVQPSVAYLFSDFYRGTTIRLMIIWVSCAFIYYGVTLLMPAILQNVFGSAKEEVSVKYLSLIGISIMQFLGYAILPYLIDQPKLGKKKVLFLGLATTVLASVLLILSGSKYKVTLCILLGIIKMSNSMYYQITLIYTSELYETLLRSKALTTCSILGKISIIVVGLVGTKALNWLDGNGFYLIFLVLSSTAAYSAWTIPQKKIF